MKYLFILTLILSIVGCASSEDEEKFIKDYKLLKLDGVSCSDCIIIVNKGHTYDILKNKSKVGEQLSINRAQ